VGYAVGIDLGTMYSAAAVGREGRVDVFGLGVTAPVIPSVVVLREDGEILTGEAADRRSVTEPARTAREFKRRLGDPVPVILGGTPYGAEALMAYLLRAIVDAVTEREGEAPTVVVLTHPANYTDYKRGLLEEAARQAGLDLATVRFITEPEAAAISYSREQRVEPGEVVAVYDFGGGTFDAAVVRKTESGFELIGSPEGMDRLGGVDIDQAVIAHVDQSVDGMLGQADADDPAARAGLARLRDDARQAKEALSTDTDTTILVSLPGLQTEVRLTREELEGMIRPRIRETVDALGRAVASAGLQMEDVSRILLVGGSSRIPLVGQLVREYTGRPVASDAHPKLAVATGAALAFGLADAAGVTAVDAPTESTPTADDSAEVGEAEGDDGRGVAAATVGGLAATGLAAGAVAGASTSGAAAGAVAGGAPLGPGSMASGPGVMTSGPGTMTSGPGTMAVSGAAKAGRSKLPLIIGAGVGVVAAVVAFTVLRGGSGGTKKATTASTQTTQATGSTTSTSSPAGALPTGRGLSGIVTTIAGNGTDSGDGIPGPALAASLGTPNDVAVTPNGDAYMIDQFASRLLRISGGQVTEAYVANGAAGEAGLSGVAVGPDGKVVFGSGRGIARLDGTNHATLLVDRIQQRIGRGGSLAYGPDGTLYFGSGDTYRVYAIHGGTAVPIAGDGTQSVLGAGKARGDGGSALSANFNHITGIAVGPDSTIYVADSGDARVRAFKEGGDIATVAGGGTIDVSTAGAVAPEGTPPTKLLLGIPTGVSVAKDGTVYVAIGVSHVIFRFKGTAGLEAVIADVGGVTKQNGQPANKTRIGGPGDLLVVGDTLYYFDGTDLRTLENL
jgi:actin-like ATPase involved in cell morphogenesis